MSRLPGLLLAVEEALWFSQGPSFARPGHFLKGNQSILVASESICMWFVSQISTCDIFENSGIISFSSH